MKRFGFKLSALVLGILAGLAPLAQAQSAPANQQVPAAQPLRVVKENIEWLDVWVPGNNTPSLPKVLLVGDSITRGYYKEVEDRLKGKAIVGRLTTSQSIGGPGILAEVAVVLSQTPFDVVHFNNGLHGFGYSEAEYEKALPDFLAAIRKGAPKAKLIWGSTTPVRTSNKLDQLDPKNERVQVRNKAAAALMEREKIAINDLFSVLKDHPEWYSTDGIHLNQKGTIALAEQVAKQVTALLPEKK